MIKKISSSEAYDLDQEYLVSKFYIRLRPALKWVSDNFEEALSPAEVWREYLYELPRLLNQRDCNIQQEPYLKCLRNRLSVICFPGKTPYELSEQQIDLNVFLILFCIVYRLMPIKSEHQDLCILYFQMIRKYDLYEKFIQMVSEEEDKQIAKMKIIDSADFNLTIKERTIRYIEEGDMPPVYTIDNPNPGTLINNNTWFKSKMEGKDVNIYNLRMYLYNYFVAYMNKNYQWMGAYLFCVDKQYIVGNENIDSFCEQMNKEGWFPGQGCSKSNITIFNFLNKKQRTWTMNDYAGKHKNVNQTSIANIKDSYDRLVENISSLVLFQ